MKTSRSAQSANDVALAALCFLAFIVQGFAVTRHGEPGWLLPVEHALRGHSLLVAWVLTWMCYVYVLAPLYAVLIVLAIVSPRWRVPAIASIVISLACWQSADLFQHLFARPRRLDWLVRRESAFSYPSSHAAISTGFYFLWALMLRASELPALVRYGGFWVLTLLTAAIIWSRLALAAHYVTDVVGGVLLAGTIILLGLAVSERFGWRFIGR
ncbi:MAG: phosphatase PAP2 family protein [Vulcanimicrobiaceae bacterium]